VSGQPFLIFCGAHGDLKGFLYRVNPVAGWCTGPCTGHSGYKWGVKMPVSQKAINVCGAVKEQNYDKVHHQTD
jgi:hypothetical protein